MSTITHHRLTVDQYHEMVRAGILTAEDRVELLEGWLVTKMAQGPTHYTVMDLLREELAGLLPSSWHVAAQRPITLADSEPEPDLSVVRGDRRDYTGKHPGPSDLGLVIEVADSSIARDRGPKKRVYAYAGIPVYWIVSLGEEVIEVYSGPDAGPPEADYANHQVFGSGDDAPFLLEGEELGRISVRQLLGLP